MANLFNRPNTGNIRGRLRERAMSTITGGPVMQDDDYLSLYLPSNEIKADKEIRSSSPQGVGATPVSTPEESTQPRIQSPAGIVAEDITQRDVQDIIDFAEGVERAIDAGQTSNILSPLDPVKVGELENKARTLLGQEQQNTIKQESNFEQSMAMFDPAIIPHVKSNSTQFDTSGTAVDPTSSAINREQQRQYRDYQEGIKPSFGRYFQIGMTTPAIVAKEMGLSNKWLDAMFSFLNDSQNIRVSHIAGDINRINTKLDKQLSEVQEYLDMYNNRKQYRNMLETQYDTMDPELLAEVQMSLANSEEYLRQNQVQAMNSLKELYMQAHDQREYTSERNPLDQFVGLSLSRDARGVSQGQRLEIKDLDGLYAYLGEAKERNQEDANKRLEEYREEMKVLHWMNDIYRVSDEYNKKREEGEFKWTDPESWYYQVPGTLGSSFAEGKAMAIQFGTAVGAHYITKALPRTAATGGTAMIPMFLTSLAVGGATTYSNYIARAQESGAEVFDAYKSKIYENLGQDDPIINDLVQKATDNNGYFHSDQLTEEEKAYIQQNGRYGKILNEGKAQLEARGVDLTGYTDDEILNEMLVYGIRTSDNDFNQATKEGLEGLDNMWQNNMALGAMDMAESMMIIPGVGRAFKTVAKTVLPGPTGVLSSVSEVATKATEKALTNTTRSIAKNMSRVGLKVSTTGVEIAAKKLLEPAARIGLTMAAEATEEGSQFMAAYDYANGKFQGDANIFGAPFRTMVNATDAWRGLLGIHSDDALNNDKELAQNMKMGAVVALVHGGAVRAIPSPMRRGNILEAWDAIAGARIAQQMTAEQIAAKEEMANISTYARKALSRPDSREYYLQQMEEMKNMLPENSTLTTADIDHEITRAKRAFALIDDPLTNKLADRAGIRRNSEDFQTLVAMRVRAQEHYNEAKNAANAYNNVYNQQFVSPEINDHLEAQGYAEEDYQAATQIAKMNSEIKFLEEFLTGIKDFHGSLQEMNDTYGSDIFTINKENADNYIIEATNMLNDRKDQQNKLLNVYRDEINDIKEGRKVFDNKQEESDRLSYLENTVRGLEELDMSGISYSTGVNMANMIAANLNLKEAAHRNNIYNGNPDVSSKYGKQIIKSKAEAIKKDIEQYNLVGRMNDAINEMSIQQQHDELLGQNEERRNVVESVKLRTKSIEDQVQKKLDRTKEPVSAIPNRRIEEEVSEVEGVTKEGDEWVARRTDPSGNIVEASFPTREQAEQRIRETQIEAPVDTEEAQPTVTTPEVEKVPETAPERVIEPVTAPTETPVVVTPSIEPAVQQSDETPNLFAGMTQVGEGPTLEATPAEVIVETTITAEPTVEDEFLSAVEPFTQYDPEAIAQMGEVTPTTKFNNLKDLVERTFEEVDENNLPNVKEAVSTIQRAYNELSDLILDPTVQTIDNAEWLSDVEDMIDNLNTIISNQEVQPEITQDIFAGMSQGNINFDPVPEDRGDNPTLSEVQPVPSNPESQEAGPDQSNITGIQDTEEFQEAKEELNEPDINIFLGMTQVPEGMMPGIDPTDNPAVVEEPKPIDNTPRIPDGVKAIAQMLDQTENLSDDVVQEIGAELGLDGFIDPDRFGLRAGTVFVNPSAKEAMYPFNKQGYSNGTAFVKMLANPRGLDGADIFVTVGEPGSQFSPNFQLHDQSTWNSAAIYIHVHTQDGKKYVGALRTPERMRTWYAQNNKQLNPLHAAAHERLRNHIIELYAQHGPDVKLIPRKITRNSGRFNINWRDNQRVFRPVKEVKGFNLPEDVSQLETADSEFRFGVGQGVRKDFIVVGASEEKLPLPGRAKSGVVLLYIRKQDTTDPSKTIYHKLNSVRLGDDPKLLDYVAEAILLDPHMHLESIRREHGVNIRSDQLLNLAVNFGDHTIINEEDKAIVPFLVEKQFYKDVKTGNIVVGTRQYTREELLTEEGRNEFKEQLANNFHFNTPIDGWADAIMEIRQQMINHNRREIKLSKYLNFDLDDVALSVDEEGNVVLEDAENKGLTMLQYHVKHDLLLSDLQDDLFTDVFMYVDDVVADIPQSKQNTQEVVQAEITPIEDKVETSDPLTDDMFRDFQEFVGVDMRIGDSTDAVMTQREAARQKKVNTKKAIKFLTDKLGLTDDQVIVTNGVIRTLANGSKVYGTAMRDAINISTDAIEGVEYHEAWHRISLLVHTPAQRTKVYEQARAEYPEYAGLTNKQLEEALAERFRDYMINNRGFKYTIQKFFSPIKTFISKLFGIATQPPSAMTQLYDQIARGDFKNYQLDAESIKEFESAYAQGADFTVGPNNDFTPKTLVSPHDWIRAIRSLMTMGFMKNSIVTLEQIKTLELKEVKDIMSAMINHTKSSNVAAILQELLDNFETVVKPEILTEMERLAVKMVNEEQTELKEQEDGAEIQKMSYNDKPSFYQSKKNNALSGAKFFIASQPITEFRYTTDENGVVTRSIAPYINPQTGMYEFIDFDSTWNLILNNMYMVDTFDDLINKAIDLSKESSFFATLASRLQKISKEGNTTLMTQLLQTIKSHKHNMMTIGYSTTILEDGKTVQVNWSIDDAETDRIARAYPRVWSSNFYSSTLVNINEEGASLNKERITKIQEGYNKLLAIASLPNLTDTDVSRVIDNLVKMLHRIGITIDSKTIESMLGDRNRYTSNSRAVNLRNMMGNRTAGSLSYLVDELSKADEKTEVTTRKGRARVKSLSNIYEYSSVNSFVNQAARHYAIVNPDPNEMMVLGPDGNLLYPIAQHNYMSNYVNEYNRRGPNGEKSEALNSLNKDVYARNSRLRNAFNTKGSTIKLYTFTNFKANNGGDKGRSYTDISPIEDYLAKMALTSEGHLILPTMADKSTYHTLKVPFMFNTPLQVISTEKDSITDRVEPNTLQYFHNVFLDEFNTVVKYWNNKKNGEITRELSVNNYHSKDFGGMFRHIEEVSKLVNGNKEYVNLNTEIRKLKNNPEAVLNFLNDVKSFMIDNSTNGMDVLNDILQDVIQRETNTLLDYGMIAIQNGMLRNVRPAAGAINGLDQNKLNIVKTSYSSYPDALAEHFAIRSMIANHTMNTIMSIIETEKVFTGDPAFYKDVDDKIKRLPAVLSTGDNLNTSWPDGHRLQNRQRYTVTEFYDNEIASQQYDDILKLTKAAYASKNPNATEAEVNAFAIKSVAKYGLDNGKGQMNQTDATVIISPQMYMDLVEMLGELTPEVEKAFKLLMSDNTDWLNNAEQYHASLEAVVKPLKMMHFGFRNSSLGIRIPIFDKMALFPMFKIFATGDMQALYERMTGTGQYTGMPKLDMVKFTSAVKSGSQAPMSPYTDATNTQLSDFRKMVVYEQEFKNLRRQLLTDPHTEERQMLGSQVAKGVLANLRLDGEYGDGVSRPKMTGRQIRDHVYNAMNELSNKGRARVNARFLDEEGFSMEKFSKELIKLSDNPLLRDDLKYVNGEFKLPLAASSSTKWIMSSLNSLINDETVNINMPGGAFIQMSSFMTNSVAILRDSAINNGRRLKIHNMEGNAKGSMDAIVSINLFSHVIPNYELRSPIESVAWLKANGIIGNTSDVSPVAIGYRIPTQGMSSISSLRVVDVLPGNIGDTIVLPDEFTTLTGSDKISMSD